MRPRIAIPLPNSDSAYAAKVMPQYRRGIEIAGGEPIDIPINLAPKEIAQLAKTCDGVLLPGSPADVDPQKYGEPERHPETAAMDIPRDDADELLIQDAHNMRKPILGICYGMQSLNVWRSGTLKQHLHTCVQHERPKDSHPSMFIAHPVVVEAGTRLAAVIGAAIGQAHGSPKVIVNTSHHQAVSLPGDGLIVSAVCPEDGTVEAIENADREHYVVGVQWHPERSLDDEQYSKAIFVSLIEAARDWHANQRTKSADFETLGR